MFSTICGIVYLDAEISDTLHDFAIENEKIICLMYVFRRVESWLASCNFVGFSGGLNLGFVGKCREARVVLSYV
jgi:hypothetical protein